LLRKGMLPKRSRTSSDDYKMTELISNFHGYKRLNDKKRGGGLAMRFDSGTVLNQVTFTNCNSICAS